MAFLPFPTDLVGNYVENPISMVQSTTPVVIFLLSIPLAFRSTTAALLSWLLGIPTGMLVDRHQRAHGEPPGEASAPTLEAD